MVEAPTAARSIVVMGVAGCGKSTLAHALAKELGLRYVDADEYHSPANVSKMARGEALTDADRHEWLLAMRLLLDAADRALDPIVLACSALKEQYRRLLGIEPQRRPLVYIRISPESASARVAARVCHFMPSSLISSQFAALEPPQEAIEVSAEWPLDKAVEYVARALSGRAV